LIDLAGTEGALGREISAPSFFSLYDTFVDVLQTTELPSLAATTYRRSSSVKRKESLSHRNNPTWPSTRTTSYATGTLLSQLTWCVCAS